MKKVKHDKQFKKGNIPWNKGKKGLQVAWNKGLTGYKSNESHWNWSGEKANYLAIHQWIRKQLGAPTFCSNDVSHAAKRFVWANISGEYRRDTSDWQSLCNSCNLTDGIKIKEQFDENRHRRIYA